MSLWKRPIAGDPGDCSGPNFIEFYFYFIAN